MVLGVKFISVADRKKLKTSALREELKCVEELNLKEVLTDNLIRGENNSFVRT